MRAAYHVVIMFQFLQDSCKPRPTTQQLKAYEKVTEALTELIIIKVRITFEPPNQMLCLVTECFQSASIQRLLSVILSQNNARLK